MSSFEGSAGARANQSTKRRYENLKKEQSRHDLDHGRLKVYFFLRHKEYVCDLGCQNSENRKQEAVDGQ